jgi:hypothetical protein
MLGLRTIKPIVEKFQWKWDLDGCSLIATKNDLIGFVLGAPKEGDLVFAAYGSRYPLILRQEDANEGFYRFIGCAIIDELMDGEAIEMVKAGKLEEQTILLR